MIPIFRPWYGEEEVEAVAEVLRSGWIGLGPRTHEFELAFAEKMEATYAVATNSGTAALHLACLACGVGPGDEVLVPALTFVSTAHAVSYCGAKPVFVDIEPNYLTIDPEDAIRKITPKTKAIIAVHYGGHPAQMKEIWAMARQYGLFVIEDAAHACGALYKGWEDGYQLVGELPSDATCFSFHAVKNLATGDGGMITTTNRETYDRLNRLRWCGIDKSTWGRLENLQGKPEYRWDYTVDEVGYKSHMNDITAALGLVQLKKLDRGNQLRYMITEHYNEAFENLGWLEIPTEAEWATSANHLYVVRTEHRDALYVWLKERQISSGVHYRPLHHYSCYKDTCKDSLPQTERTWKTILTLPLYPSMDAFEVGKVIEQVIEFGEEL